MKKIHCTIWLLLLSGIFCHSQGNGAADDYLNIYQRYLRGLKNTRCSMYPSCSNYAKMVFQDYPFPVAMALTADRLTRCSHDLSVYQTTFIYGFPSAVDCPKSRTVPDGVIADFAKPPVFVSNSYHDHDPAYSSSVRFIAFLINQKNYQGALDEIDKAMFKGSLQDFSELCACKLKCFEGLGRYQDGILAFEQYFPDSVKNNYQVVVNAAHLYGLNNNQEASLKYYEEAATLYASNRDKAHPYGELGKIYAKRGLYEDARSAFKSKYYVDKNYDSYQSSLRVIDGMILFKRKNKAVAMVMSAIPGFGYIYTKQPKNALTALVLNGVMGYAAYTSYKSKNYGVGFIMSVLNLSFYIGNIVGSGASAERYNASYEKQAIDDLQSINPFIN